MQLFSPSALFLRWFLSSTSPHFFCSTSLINQYLLLAVSLRLCPFLPFLPPPLVKKRGQKKETGRKKLSETQTYNEVIHLSNQRGGSPEESKHPSLSASLSLSLVRSASPWASMIMMPVCVCVCGQVFPSLWCLFKKNRLFLCCKQRVKRAREQGDENLRRFMTASEVWRRKTDGGGWGGQKGIDRGVVTS